MEVYKGKPFEIDTDTVDDAAKSIGVAGPGYSSRGLCIQIRHNRSTRLVRTAKTMAEIIERALNEAVERGELVLPTVGK